MAGRASEVSLTISRNIVSYLEPLKDGTIVDVGCGDGTLLSLLNGDRIGISPSDEEVEQLQKLWTDVRFRVGLAQALLLEDRSVATLLCNSVFLYLETAASARDAVAEFSRVCRPGAQVFLGEVPTEPVRREYRHDSVAIWLWSLLTRGGPKHFLAGLRDVAKASIGDAPLLFYPERWFYCPREEFISLCAAFGLNLVRDRTSPHVDSRRDYLFSKK